MRYDPALVTYECCATDARFLSTCHVLAILMHSFVKAEAMLLNASYDDQPLSLDCLCWSALEYCIQLVCFSHLS